MTVSQNFTWSRVWFWLAIACAILAGAAANADAGQASASGGPPLTGENYAIGQKVYASKCAACHDAGLNRAPQKRILANLSPEAIYKSLTSGTMRAMATGLSDKEKVAVSEYLAERKLGSAGLPDPASNRCTARYAAFDMSDPPVLSGWGFNTANSHAIPTEIAGITPANLGALKLKWAYGFANSARIRSQPSIAGGAIFIGSQDGFVHALDRETGCERWRYSAKAEVRTAIVIAPWDSGDTSADPLAYFGDQAGNVYAVKAFSGEPVWQKKADEHTAAVITGSPALHGDRLFVPVSSLEEASAADPRYPCCTFRGSVVALDAATGEETWRTYMVDESSPGKRKDGEAAFGPSGVAVWNAPAIDAKRNRLYVATGDNYSEPATDLSDAIVALDMNTGKIAWHYQATAGDVWNVACYIDGPGCPEDEGPDFDFGAGTILASTQAGRDLVLAGQKSGIAYGVDADTGKLVWQQRVGRGGITGGVLFGIAASGGRLFTPVSDTGEHKTAKLPPKPGLYALDIDSGKVLWEQPAKDVCTPDRQYCDPGLSGAITATPELVFAGADDGHFRIYSATTGEVLKDFDLVKAFKTINGIAATGGSMSGGSAAIAQGGQLILTSGYGHAFKMPGNVVLVYEVQ